MLEYVEHPVETLLELQRVARVAVVLTTEEIRYDRAFLDDYLFRRPGWPHMERNLFHPDDLAGALPAARLLPQCDAPPPQQSLTVDAARAWILANTRSEALAPGRIGVVAVIPGPAFAARPRAHDDDALLLHLLAAQATPGATAPPPPLERQQRWLGMLRDPRTHAPLAAAGDSLRGSRTYPLADGIPDFVDADADPPSRDALVARVAALPSARREALLALRDRLFLPDRWPQDVFDLTQREHRRASGPTSSSCRAATASAGRPPATTRGSSRRACSDGCAGSH